MQKVQIDLELFIDICDFFFSETAPEDYKAYKATEIKEKLSEKIDKIITREIFSRYKRLPTGTEREAARQEYLERKGILQSFRTDIEKPM